MFLRPFRFSLLLALGLTLSGQTTAKDIDGWDKIKWGMTMSEVHSVYNVDAKPETKDDWMLLQLSPVKMGGVEMGVQVAAKSGVAKVASVRLWSYFGLPTSVPGASAGDFDTLRTLLIQKYGQPDNEETQHGENFRIIKTVSWTFPSTSILMTLEASTSIPNLGNIDLVYTPK